MLKKCVRKSTGEMEWALVSNHNSGKILKWFGKSKPSPLAVQKEEERVEKYKHMKGR